MSVERPEFEARLNDLAQGQREFRKESGEQHRRLEGKVTDLGEALDVKIGAVIKSIVDEKETRAERRRNYMLVFSGTTSTFLMGILYKLVGG